MKDTSSKKQKQKPKEGDKKMIGIQVTDGTVACRKCGKSFKNQTGVTTHYHRVHSGKIQVPNQGGKEVNASKKPARVGKPWTKAQHAKFKKTMALKKNGEVPQPQPEKLDDPRDYIPHCPHCGGELNAFFLAAGVIKRRRHGDY